MKAQEITPATMLDLTYTGVEPHRNGQSRLYACRA